METPTSYTAIVPDTSASIDTAPRYTKTHMLCAVFATALTTALLVSSIPRTSPAANVLSPKLRQSAADYFASLPDVRKGDQSLKAPRTIILAYETGGEETEDAVALAAKLLEVRAEIEKAGVPVVKMLAVGGQEFYLETLTGWNDLYLPCLVFTTRYGTGNVLIDDWIPDGKLDWEGSF